MKPSKIRLAASSLAANNPDPTTNAVSNKIGLSGDIVDCINYEVPLAVQQSAILCGVASIHLDS